jgi:hypothetical protein
VVVERFGARSTSFSFRLSGKSRPGHFIPRVETASGVAGDDNLPRFHSSSFTNRRLRLQSGPANGVFPSKTIK